MTAQVDPLLQVWETRAAAHPIERALALLAAAWPERDEQSWAQTSIGERDACLLTLRETLFGATLETTTRCPACGEQLESSFATTDIRVLPAPAATALHFAAQGYDIRVRLPTSADVLAVSGAPTDVAALALLQRCTLAMRRFGTAIDAAQLPPDIAAELGARMAAADPGADIRIALNCPACAHAWSLAFDIVSYLWGELDDWAQALLVDVHLLASAYGWREADILALSPVRRQFYLDLVQGSSP